MKSKEEIKKWLLENAVNKRGELDLSGLDFSGFTGSLDFSGIKTRYTIYNYEQKARVIYNQRQKATTICNNEQKAKRIDNVSQEAQSIYGTHNAKRIEAIKDL